MAEPIRITDAADYWRLRAALGDVSDAKLKALEAAREHAQALTQAHTRRDAILRELGERYGFDPNGAFECDDTACALVPQA